jgi:hypothetical protein
LKGIELPIRSENSRIGFKRGQNSKHFKIKLKKKNRTLSREKGRGGKYK